MLPAAKKGDLCVHQGMITTGSPDTTTMDKPSARLGDQHDCKTHPPGCPPWPPGPIVTASPTVFINRLKAARHTDLLQCGAPGPPPPGTANPITEEYRVRPDDSYHKLMAGEHEIQERDKVKDKKEPDKGQTDEADDPTGVAEAAAPPKVTKQPSAAAVTYKGKKGDQQNPYGQQAEQFKKDHKARTLGSDLGDPAMAGEVGVGSVSAGVVIARKEDAPPGQKTPLIEARQDEQKNRTTITLNLGFSMELSVGTRSTTVRAGAPMDMIVPLPHTVWIGGPVPPAPPPIEAADGEAAAEPEKEKLDGKKIDGQYMGSDGKGGYQNYPDATDPSQVRPVTPRAGEAEGEIIHVNGIYTSPEDHFAALQALADHKGANVVGIYNNSTLGEAALDKANLGDGNAVDTLADLITTRAEAGEPLNLSAHSHGGLVVSRALTQATNAYGGPLPSNIKVDTYGAAAYTYPKGPTYTHYVNVLDPVPMLTGKGGAVLSDNVKHFVGHSGFDVHGFTDVYLPRTPK